MPYNVRIQNEQGQPLPGTVYFYDAAGDAIGEATVAPAGSDLSADIVERSAHFWVVSPGYSRYGTSTIYEDGNTFTLIRSVPTITYLGLGAVGVLVLVKLFKVRV